MEPTFSGLDVQSALKRLGGNTALYHKLLDRFRGAYTPDAAALAAALEAGDMASAEREAHTLKGLAGSLGADALQSAAAELEHNCKPGANPDVYKAGLANVQSALRHALESIDQYLAPAQQTQPAPQAGPRTVDRAALAEKLAALMALLEDNDSRAASVFAALQQDLQVVAPDVADMLRRAIDSFDFSEALALAAVAYESLIH